MKKIVIGFFSAVFSFDFIAGVPCIWAQESAIDEFTLEEITVTAEKREVNVQDIPASVEAMVGAELAEQGKNTTAEILEDIPNVRVEGAFSNTGIQDSTPDSGISIRGVKYKQTSDGLPPAATATYVDGVFQGYGGNLDIERVEVLRGPQGTLYGRSATGGVVAFHTKDPILEEYGGNTSVEFGEANLRNFQGAVNIPVTDFLALRAAGRFYEKDGYYNPNGGYYGERDGRIKAFFKPSDTFDFLVSYTINERRNNSGGYGARLTSPTTVDHEDTKENVVEGPWRRGDQWALTSNYDFGGSILTYIASLRHYEDTASPPSVQIKPGSQVMHNQFLNYGENFHYQEMRLASDSEGLLSWLIGANYYNADYDRYQVSMNHRVWYEDEEGNVVENLNPAAQDAPIFEQPSNGEITNFGIFTEETYDVSDRFRITGGLRFDKTENHAYSAFNMNVNENEYRHSLKPAEWVFFPYEDTLEWENITYKVRLEYDITSDNMLYLLTATGFQPGDIRITNKMGPEGISMYELPYDEEKLTSYEAGSKNRLLDGRLQLNVSVFYYDYEGYRHTVNTAQAGPPVYAILTTPLRMFGTELSSEWLITDKDRVAFSMGAVDAKITGYPDIPELNPTKEYMMLERLPGLSPLTANLEYDHVFSFDDSTTLVPRAEMRYTDGMYVTNLMASELESGLAPYAYQDSYVITDVGATWNSASDKYSLTVYARNIFDTEYKADVDITGGKGAVGVTVGNPRTWGVVFRAMF